MTRSQRTQTPDLEQRWHMARSPDTAVEFKIPIARLWTDNGLLFLQVIAPTATVVHEEHRPITLPRGTYCVWMQREYTPREIRAVID